MRFLSRISVRLLLFNVLLVFLPVVGLLYFNVFERQLLDFQERSMVQQGRLLAAALSGAEALDPGEARRVLRQLGRRTEARLRVVDRSGQLLADSSRFGPRAAPPSSEPYSAAPSARESWLYRGAAALFRLAQQILQPPEAPRDTDTYYPAERPLLGPEVRAALAGRYGSATRHSDQRQRSLTLYSAIPVRDAGGRPVGAVLVSQSTLRILTALVDVRFDVFRVFLASLAVAAVLSLLLAGTIARPLRRLRDEANALADRRGRLLRRFRGSTQSDEIGDLARALEELTRRLERHLHFVETFASDVSHEFKNPLAAIRAATELLADSTPDDPQDRERFLALVQKEVARLERLLSGVSDLTRADAGLEEPDEEIDLTVLLTEIAESFEHRASGIRFRVLANGSLPVRGHRERLAQLFENLLDNARSFSPPEGEVVITLQRGESEARICVDDSGPGIPAAHLDKIFDRFFTWRPGKGKTGEHNGLGLAICRAISEGAGGSIRAMNRGEGGARFEVRLPLRR